jgi:hypothetical protein
MINELLKKYNLFSLVLRLSFILKKIKRIFFGFFGLFLSNIYIALKFGKTYCDVNWFERYCNFLWKLWDNTILKKREKQIKLRKSIKLAQNVF